MDKSKVSVITVVYNDYRNIKKTIDNVAKQTYDNIEYIIVDGNSTDGTKDIIKENEKYITKWISEPDKGLYDAMNKGVQLATGDWIIFRNCGDYFYHPSVIEDVFRFYQDNGEDFILCDIRYFKDYGYKDFKPNILNHHYFDAMPVNHPSTFIRRTTQLKYPFRLRYKNSADYCFFIEAFEKGAKYKYIPLILSLFDNNSGASTDFFDKSIKENIDILSYFKASAATINRLRKKHKIIKLKNKLRKFVPLYSVYHSYNLKKQGWVKTSTKYILQNI